MRDIDLFQLALGLVPPWMVADAKFDAEKKRLDIEIDFKTGGRSACPECGKTDCPVHGAVKKIWRHRNFRAVALCAYGPHERPRSTRSLTAIFNRSHCTKRPPGLAWSGDLHVAVLAMPSL